MQTCAACGGAARRTKLAIVIGGDDGPRRARVCKDCERRGEFIVPMRRPVVNDTAKAERAELRDVLAPFIRRCEALAKHQRAAAGAGATNANMAAPAAYAARAEAYEAIAHMLKEGRA